MVIIQKVGLREKYNSGGGGAGSKWSFTIG